jgi:hypothetical protein
MSASARLTGCGDRLRARLRWMLEVTRPVDPGTEQALIGRRSAGCEGTHGVFPRCNLACTPCYHAREANSVRIDAGHTEAEVDRQMAYLRSVRGTAQHAQLIGGEVTLLGPEGHAAALKAMERHGRKPMSMTHGDFDYDYLERLAIAPDGRRRFGFLRVAGHFDSMMLGRRGIPRPQDEAELHPYRRRFVEHFERLRDEHGVRFDLAHNMTVTPRNLAQVGEVVRACLGMEFGMLSFQPAAFVGNPKRWREDYREVTIDAVWHEIEQAVGRRIPWQHVQMGDPRCNRSCHGILAGGRWTPLLDDRNPRDLRARDIFFEAFASMDFERAPWVVAAATARVVARNPRVVPTAAAFAARLARRVGLRRLLRGRPRPLTFVVHAFMDAEVVRPAWEAIERGGVASEPEVRAAQERLQACSYAMAHPDEARLVPACVQHSVLDPQENLALRRLLQDGVVDGS